MKYSLKALYQAGLISYIPTLYIDIAEKKESLKATGMNNKQSEKALAKDMKISPRTVRRASDAKKRLDKAVKLHNERR